MRSILMFILLILSFAVGGAFGRDFHVTAGDDRIFTLTVKDQNNDIVDITGDTIIFTVKKYTYLEDTDAVIQLTTTGGGIVITDGTNGIAQLTLTPTETDPDVNTDLELTTYYYDIQVTHNNRKYTVIKGKITFTYEITND